MLPKTKLNKGDTPINKRIICVYGAPKVGKTTFASRLYGGNGLFLATEEGQDYVDCFQTSFRTEKEMGQALADIELLKKEDNIYTGICLDTADNLLFLLTQMVIDNESRKGRKIEHIGDIPMGKGYHFVALKIAEICNRLINQAKRLNIGLCFISHSKTNDEKKEVTPGINNSSFRFINQACDMIALMVNNKGERELIIGQSIGSYSVVSGERTGKMKQKTSVNELLGEIK